MKIAYLIILLITCTVATRGWASASRDVPLGDPTYRHLDLLAARGHIRSMISGQRPFPRQEVARMLREARGRLNAQETVADDATRTWLAALELEFAKELAALQGPVAFTPLASSITRLEGLSSRPRDVASNNGLGDLSAQVNPLVANRHGDHLDDGYQTTLETHHYGQLSNFFVFDVVPRFALPVTRAGGADFDPTLRTAYGRFNAGNFELTVGRNTTIWGPGEFGGVLLSANAPPLDMIRVHTPHPFHLPWIFRYIGSLKGTMLFTDLGTTYQPTHTILSGYRLDIQPQSWITVGLNHLVMMGGRNMIDPSIGDAMQEFLGIGGFFRGPGHGAANSNHLVGIDLQVQIPQWRGVRLYGSYAYEDPDKDLGIQFDTQALWQGGVYLPLLTRDGAWSLRLEYSRAGAGVYRHSQYQSGWANKGQVLGLPYGGNSNAAVVTVTRARFNQPPATCRVGVVQRSNDSFLTTFDSSGDRLDIVKSVDRPDEWGTHVTLASTVRLNAASELRINGGYEHVWNSNFVKGDHGNHFLAGIMFQTRFAK